MDFGQLLHTAQKNEKLNKAEGRYYKTKFEPPKKEKKAKELSANIKKFLARKEAEEKKKAELDRKKKEELLALRSQDKKATRRVNVMLKRTKSANQSVIEEAVDNNNTAVTLAGPMQPDEDDYGYVSQEASAFYNKMMEKYSKMPEEPKFNLTKKKVSTNLLNTKDRVKAALDKEKEEAMQPHRRKRKHKDKEQNGDDEEGISYEQPEQSDSPPLPPKPKPRPPPPPPMNFAELLKIAEKKQFEPILIEKKEKDEEKLLTKKQRKEMEKEREYLQRRDARREAENRGLSAPISNSNRIPKVGEKPGKTVGMEKNDKISKLNGQNPVVPSSTDARFLKPNSSHPSAKTSFNRPIPNVAKDVSRKLSLSTSSDKNQKKPVWSITKTCGNSVLSKAAAKPSIPSNSSKSSMPSNSNYRASNRDQENVRHNVTNTSSSSKHKNLLNYTSHSKPKEFPPKDLISKKSPGEDLKPRKYLPEDLRSMRLPPSDMKPKKFPPDDLKGKQFPPKDIRPKQFPPSDVRRKEFPSGDIKKKPVGNKRRILDDDSEYDSEMDDFIDDDEPEDDYSKYISEIFGYDKSKYRDADTDVDNMESTFAQQMREEVISTKIGIMEDLEDMKKEEEEKRRKALMKKQRKL